eukprot:Tbor_TRINITY_DN5455_c3_g1::TRINITY_DN5455_c3_g1_i1::g.24804::m.24804
MFARTLISHIRNTLFGDPVSFVVDDDELPLPEHRVNTSGSNQSGDLNMISVEGLFDNHMPSLQKRLRVEKGSKVVPRSTMKALPPSTVTEYMGTVPENKKIEKLNVSSTSELDSEDDDEKKVNEKKATPKKTKNTSRARSIRTKEKPSPSRATNKSKAARDTSTPTRSKSVGGKRSRSNTHKKRN